MPFFHAREYFGGGSQMSTLLYNPYLYCDTNNIPAAPLKNILKMLILAI